MFLVKDEEMKIKDKDTAFRAITQAKKELDKGDYDSVNLANYILRDLEATKEAGLSDLAWAMHRDGSLHRNDVLGLIEHLEKFLESGVKDEE